MRLWTAVLTSALFLLAISISFSISNFQLPIQSTPKRQSKIGNRNSEMSLAGLSRLQLERQIRITHALAFVSIRLAQFVHFRANLTQLLLVDA